MRRRDWRFEPRARERNLGEVKLPRCDSAKAHLAVGEAALSSVSP